MHGLRLTIIFVVTVLLTGCFQGTPKNGELIMNKMQSEDVTDDTHMEQIITLEKEKEAFLSADRFGRELYNAMVHADLEKLKQLTAASTTLQSFDDRFEVTIGEELVVIPFGHLQTEPHLNNRIILKTNGFGFDQREETFRIHYMIIDPEVPSSYFLNINFFKKDLFNWSIVDVEFDI